jgi:hypothetical protein
MLRFWDSGLWIVIAALNCLALFMTWRTRGFVRYPYATLYLGAILLLDALRGVFFIKFGLLSTEYYLAYWFTDYLARLLVCLAALEFIELALEGSRPQIARSAFFLSRLFVVVASGIVFISYCAPRLTNREGRLEFQLAIYLSSTLLVLLAWIAYGRRGRFELQPRMLIAAMGLNSAIYTAGMTMQHFAFTVAGRQAQPIVDIAMRSGPVGFLVLEGLWLYAVTRLGPPKATEAHEAELIPASDRPSTLTVAFTRAKEET